MQVHSRKGTLMKKGFRAILASVFAFALALMAVVPAYATSTGVGEPNVTPTVGTASTSDLVVATANAGDTLGAYKVIRIEYKANNTLDYTFTPLFTNFLGSSQYTQYVDNGGAAVANVDAYKGLGATDLKALLGAFTAYIKAQNPVPAATYTQDTDASGSATFEDVDMGQYIIVGLGNPDGGKLVYQTVTAEVEPKAVNGAYKLYASYNVEMKTTKPTPEKEITGGTFDDNGTPTASVGDTISYKISATVPTYPDGATNTTFYMRDVLSNGLTLSSTAAQIAVKGVVTGVTGPVETPLTLGTDYTITISGQTLYIDFVYDKIKGYEKVTAAYDAILNENAVTGISVGNPNTYTLIWSNNPYNGGTHTDHPTGPGYGQEEVVEKVYTYALRIEKFEKGTNPHVSLEGATFQILSSDKTVVLGTITTDANGFAAFSGLEAGTYYLRETVAPTGYKLLTEDIEVKLNKTNATETVTTTTTKTYTTVQADALIPTQAIDAATGQPLWLPTGAAPGTAPTAAATAPDGMVAAYLLTVTTTVETSGSAGTAAQGYFTVEVENVPGSNLPTTGGMGTTILYVIGGVLVLGSAVLMITKKRMANAEQ